MADEATSASWVKATGHLPRPAGVFGKRRADTGRGLKICTWKKGNESFVFEAVKTKSECENVKLV